MENITRETLYRQFFDATVGRFYTEEQSLKLLHLFASECGLKKGEEEYNTVMNTVKFILGLNINDIISSTNLGLLTSFNAPNKDVRTAAKALAEVFKSRAKNESPVYANDVSWRISIFKSLSSDSAKLEAAYIKYVNDDIQEAVDLFKDLLKSGSMTALSHLAIISYETSKYSDAYRYLSMVLKVYTKELYMPSVQWVEELRNYVALFLTEDTVSKIDEEVGNEKPFLSRTNTRIGGFGGFIR